MIDRTGRTWQWLMVAAAVAGGLVLAGANQQTRLWWMFPLFIIGMGLVSLSLLSLHETIERRLDERRQVTFPKRYGAVFVVGVAMVVGAIVTGGPSLLPIAGTILVVLGSSGLSVWVKRRVASGRTGSAEPPVAAGSDGGSDGSERAGVDGAGGEEPSAVTKAYVQRSEAVMEVVADRFPRIGVGSLPWYGFEGMAVGVGLLLIDDGVTSIIGIVVWLAGLVVAKFGVQPYLRSRGRGLHRVGRILIDTSLAGLFVLFVGAFGGSLLLVLLGGSVMIVSVSLIGIAALEIVNVANLSSEEGNDRTYQMITGAVLAAVLTLWYVAWVTNNLGLAFVLMVLTVGAGMWFVFRGEWIMIALLAGYVLSWGLVDRADPVSVAVAADVAAQPVTMVAVGDSFVSGEGARRFFEGTNDVGGNQCRRAPTAYPYVVAAALRMNVVSTACSGAKIADLTTCGQMWPSGRRCRDSGWDVLPDDVPIEPAGAIPQLAELDRLRNTGGTTGDDGVRVPPLEPEVVVVSIGGNDVGFSSIVKACLLPKGCDERREFWLSRVDGLRSELADLYRDVAARFEGATVLVMPYPMLVDENTNRSCDLGLSKGEREFVIDFIDKLDGVIEAAAAAAEVTYLAEAKGVFEQAKLCDDPAAANHLRVVPPAGHRLGRYSPSTWIPGSMHPNELGHERTAGVLCRTVAEITERDLPPRCRELLDAIPEPEVEPGPGEGAPLEGVNTFAAPGALAETSDRCAELLAGEGADDASTSSSVPSSAPAADEAAGDVTGEDATGDDTTGEEAVPDDVEAATEQCAVGEAVDVLSGQVTAVTDELLSDDEWIRDELFRTIRALALPLALFLAAGLVLAAGLARVDHPIVNFLCGRRRIGEAD